MSLSEELGKLGELHARGLLGDEEFARAKARLIDGGASSCASGTFGARSFFNALRRSRDDRWLGGVCGGLARATGVESWLCRLLLVLLVFCGGTGLLAYLLLWIFVPDEGPARLPLAGPAN
ncbi:conserved hypothetical protein [Rubrivivax sp. A210]|uniref:PspC domain-containing protein n=1 Tax=Rubrivivax sp. A210 TaxID=2772301 RepID=UPI001919E0A1|nr:PspC domain-containing protein [Rubrivivax sp. A210]CAD5374688.1 conserved hypothetical protein [Rubrivivax sp. A210]